MSIFNIGYNILCEDTIDKFLLTFEKPIEKVFNKDIILYHGSKYDIKDKVLTPMGINVGATKYSNPRWSTFFWDNRDSAIDWALFRTLSEKHFGIKTFYGTQNNKTLLTSRDGTYIDIDTVKDVLRKFKPTIYVYTTKVSSNKVEIGSTKLIQEYTVSEPVTILRKEKIRVTSDMIRKHFDIVQNDEFKSKVEVFLNNLNVYQGVRKSKILNLILDDERDSYRKIVKDEIKSGSIKIGDDITHLKKQLNYAIKHDTLGLKK